jgi:class 3 adenylate cyclase
VQSDYFCGFCNLRQETALDDFVEVCFTVSETVRPIRFHHPETLSAVDFYLHAVFSPLALVETGKRFIDGVRPLIRAVEFLAVGASETFRFDATPGLLHGYDHLTGAALNIPVLDEPALAEQHLRVTLEDDAFRPEHPTVSTGPLVLEVTNTGSKRGSLVLMAFPPQDLAATPFRNYEPFLHAKDLLTNQIFRELFGEELVIGVESLKVRDLTFLFTDLKGSTALYDRIGDLTAFALVQQHFLSMKRIVQANAGAIVKTIGDAVMAAFGRPDDAARAAAGMLAELEPGGDTGAGRDVVLKIGLHRGSVIAVTLNDRLDYFGQTVNIASRVQQMADADEICLTDEVMRSDGVSGVLSGFASGREEAMLKGVRDAMSVHRVRPRLQAGA